MRVWRRHLARLMGLLVLMATGSSLVTAATPVTVQLLSGEAATGELQALSGESLTLLIDQQAKQFPLTSLLELQVGAPAAPVPATAEVRLTDGTVLMASGCRTDATQAMVTHPRFGELRLPLTNIASLRLVPLEGATLETWKQLATREVKQDLLVIRKNEVVDHLAGVVGRIDEANLLFVLDGDEIAVKRERVLGVIFVRRPALPKSPVFAETVDGDRLVLQSLTASADSWQLRLAAGPDLKLPLSALRSVDLSAGKVLWLSSIEPRSIEYTPFLIDLGQGFSRDRGFEGKPLRLGNKTWPRGLAIRSRTTVKYRLGGDYRKFTALMGIDDDIRHQITAAVRIVGDGKPLLETDVKIYEGDSIDRLPPRPLDLDVTGVVELEITVDYGADQNDSGDRVHFVDAKVTK